MSAKPGTRPRIAIVTSFPADPARPSGGVQSVSVTLVDYLSRSEEFEWHVVTQDPSIVEPNVTPWGKATIHRLPRAKGSELVNAAYTGRRQLTAFIERLQPDLIHAHDTLGIMTRRLELPVPRVFTVHGFIFRDTGLSGKKAPWLRSTLWKPLEIAGWASHDHLISISPYVREFVSGRTKAVIHDIDNPIREDFFAIERRPAMPGRIFCAAEISPRKNTLVLVQAFERLIRRGIDTELRLAGRDAHPTYGPQVDRFIEDRGLAGKVVKLGLIPYRKVREELAAASAFALVSLEENSPMGIEEAMAAGVPVVTSNRCGMPYMVRGGESGFLVDPTKPDDVARALAEILTHDDLAERMSEVSRRIATERFHPVVVARRTLEVYRQALRQAAPRGA